MVRIRVRSFSTRLSKKNPPPGWRAARAAARACLGGATTLAPSEGKSRPRTATVGSRCSNRTKQPIRVFFQFSIIDDAIRAPPISSKYMEFQNLKIHRNRGCSYYEHPRCRATIWNFKTLKSTEIEGARNTSTPDVEQIYGISKP